MEVVEAQEALLSNYEVYALLKETSTLDTKSSSRKKTLNNVELIQRDTLKYLAETPCVDYTDEMVADFLREMQALPLTKAERLQILNLKPLAPVDLYPIVEELETRLTDEEADRIFEIVFKTLINTPSQ
eukprot:Partr_v1_DN23140_c0_g1_i2_m43999 putative CGRP receptor component